MSEPKTEPFGTERPKPPPKRTKPSDVARAEAEAWGLGVWAAERMAKTAIDTRYDLLERGFPDAHALCEDLDKDAAKWTGMAIQMRRSMVKHAELNQIQV